MRLDKWHALVLLLFGLALAALGGGCGADATGPQKDGDTVGTGDGTGNDQTGSDIIGGCGNFGADDDGDGLPNGVEDKNLNCVLDAGETDPKNPDTDGDGVLDGNEDINGDGIFDLDKGESDPNNPDSNGNGIPDGQEPASLTCTKSLLTSISPSPAQFADSNTALPSGYANAQQQTAKGMTFSNPAGTAFGFVVQTAASSANAEQENSQNLVRVAQAGNLPTVALSRNVTIPSPTWDHLQVMPLPDTTGVRARIFFAYGAGSPNASVSTKDPAVLRDELISAISGQPVASGQTTPACNNVATYWIATLRPDNTLITMAILACSSALEQSETLQFEFEDVLGGTLIAPGRYKPDDFLCETLAPAMEGGKVDFLWVIDNSGSMADEQGNVAATASKFMSTLRTSGVDWRLAVTTTEAYDITDNIPALDLTHDELIDLTTGLRGVGFLSAADADAEQLFIDYVTQDIGCTKIEGGVPLAPADSNVCGFGWEEGLRSGIVVLDATTSPSVPAAHRLRDDALRIVVWVSDEENQEVKDNTNNIIDPNGPLWAATVDPYIDRYKAHNAIGFAIVGDVGNASGGVCEPLGSGGAAIVGAQYGLSYIQVANGTGGASGSICNADLQPTIDAIIQAAIGLASSYQLRGYPIASSMRVAVDSQLIPRSHTAGWNYDPDTNAIVFFGVPIAESSRISVSYLLWNYIDG